MTVRFIKCSQILRLQRPWYSSLLLWRACLQSHRMIHIAEDRVSGTRVLVLCPGHGFRVQHACRYGYGRFDTQRPFILSSSLQIPLDSSSSCAAGGPCTACTGRARSTAGGTVIYTLCSTSHLYISNIWLKLTELES